jgi:serine/threonine protein kinase
MWSLGVTIYQVATGEHPFNTSDDQAFREEVFNARVDYSRLAHFSLRLQQIIKNLLQVDMYKRWDANMVLSFG